MTRDEIDACFARYKPNPLGRVMDRITRPTLKRIFAKIDKVTREVMIEFNGFNSANKADDGDPYHYEPASNEECAMIEMDIINTRVEFDLRKPLNHQMATWLREHAQLMLRAADAAEKVEDCRNLQRIRKLIAGEIPVKEPKAA